MDKRDAIKGPVIDASASAQSPRVVTVLSRELLMRRVKALNETLCKMTLEEGARELQILKEQVALNSRSENEPGVVYHTLEEVVIPWRSLGDTWEWVPTPEQKTQECVRLIAQGESDFRARIQSGRLTDKDRPKKARNRKGRHLKAAIRQASREALDAPLIEIAEGTDRIMTNGQFKFRDECPKEWLKVRNPPSNLAQALNNKTLKNRVKKYISNEARRYRVTDKLAS